MKRRHTPGLLVAFTMSALVLSVAATEGRPRAVPVEPIKEFKIVPKGELIKHAFEIRNDGDAPLELTDVRPACGCTVARYDETIAPGEVGKINVQLKTDSFAGPIAKSIAVFTNDAQNPKMTLVIKADVKPYIQVSPGFARFNHVQGEIMPPAPQILWAEDGSDINIKSVKAPYDHLKVEYREATEEERDAKGAGRQWRVQFTLASDAPVGALGNHVQIVLDHAKQKVVKIPISGFVRPRQHITPFKGDFGQLEGDSLPLQRKFHFQNFTGEPVQLTSIDTGFEAIKAEIKPASKESDQGFRYTLLLTIGPEMPKGAFDGMVKIQITDEQSPVIELPISGTVL